MKDHFSNLYNRDIFVSDKNTEIMTSFSRVYVPIQFEILTPIASTNNQIILMNYNLSFGNGEINEKKDIKCG